MFQEKGIILKSALSDNVKVTLALWPVEKGAEQHKMLAKVTVRRRNKFGAYKTNQPYKSWLSAREVAGVITSMQRALVLMDEYNEGTLDMKDILAEDEDARLFTATESVMYPTIEGMFDMSEALKKERETDDD